MHKTTPTSEHAAAIINLLRDNPSVGMTLTDVSDQTDIPVDELAADLAALVNRPGRPQEPASGVRPAPALSGGSDTSWQRLMPDGPPQAGNAPGIA